MRDPLEDPGLTSLRRGRGEHAQAEKLLNPIATAGTGNARSNELSMIQFGSPIISSSVWQAFRSNDVPAQAVIARKPVVLMNSRRFIK